MQPPLFSLHRGFKPRGGGAPLHAHDEAQLTFAASGMVQVHTEAGRWLVPPQLGVWIPAQVAHRVEVLADANLWMVHWAPAVAAAWAPPAPLERVFAMRVTTLLRALLHTAFDSAMAPDKTELVVRLMLHELTETADAPTFLPLPTSAVGRRVAEVAAVDYRNRLAVDDIAARAATSVRTISRVFLAETGLSFKLWRQRARIVQSMDRLARGHTIAQVSTGLGFSSTAAFSAAFRQVTAMTPSGFIEGQDRLARRL
jgi:AraC-like DNA-binding protein